MKAAPSTVPPELLAVYEKLIAGVPGVELKGATMPYTSMNGNMFSFLTKEGRLALRLGEDAREAFLKKHNASLCVQHGVVMKEYIEVPPAVLAKSAELKKAFAASCAYASTLKPKPTTRGKAKKA